MLLESRKQRLVVLANANSINESETDDDDTDYDAALVLPKVGDKVKQLERSGLGRITKVSGLKLTVDWGGQNYVTLKTYDLRKTSKPGRWLYPVELPPAGSMRFTK